MNGNGRPRRYLTLLSTLGLTLHWLGYGAFAGTPSNAVLIAAMPPGTESVMVQRALTSEGKDSSPREDIDRAPAARSTNKNIKSLVRDATDVASIIVFAWGASDFQMPPDTGMTGNYNERAIYVVKQSLANLSEQLEAGRDVEGLDERFDVAGVRVYKGTIDDKSIWGWTHNSAGEAWFVAIPDDHTVVSAESRSDIEHMLKSLKEKQTAIPRRWQTIAEGHNVESPIVILRQYPSQEKKQGPRPSFALPPFEFGITHFALTLPQVTSAKISIKAEKVDEAIEWYNRYCLHKSQYVWNVKRTDAGVTGWLGPIRQGEWPNTFVFSLILLFGPCVMI